jgi:hypothetical protein
MVAVPDLFLFSRLLWLFSIAAHATFAVKLFTTGLRHRYPAFFVYLVAAGVQFSVHFCLPWLSMTYMWTWVATETIISVLYVLVLLEADVLIFQDYPAITAAGRKALWRILPVAIMVSGFTLYPDLAHASGQRAILVYFSMLERGILFSLTLFVLLFLFFVVRYRLALRRNIVLHTLLFGVYFLCSTLAYFILNVTGQAVDDEVNVGLLGVSALALVFWTMRFEPAGEKPVAAGPRASEAETIRLINQLDALNTVLRQSKRR